MVRGPRRVGAALGGTGPGTGTRSRRAGFTGYVRTLDAFAAVFDRLAADRITPLVR